MSEVKYPNWFIEYTNDVQAMRDAQNFYFQHKGTVNLEKAKAREKKVDEWLKKFKERGIIGDKTPAPPVQNKLF